MGNELTTCHGVRNHLTLTCTQSAARSDSPKDTGLVRCLRFGGAATGKGGEPELSVPCYHIGDGSKLMISHMNGGWTSITKKAIYNLDLRNRVNWQIAVWRMYCKGFKMFQPIFGSNTRIYIYVITYMYYRTITIMVAFPVWDCEIFLCALF